MTNQYYNPTGTPLDNADVNSPELRAEFAAIGVMGNKLPILTGGALKLVRVNASATALEPVGAIDAIPIGATTPSTGAFTTLTATTLSGNGAGITGLTPAPVSSVFGRIGAVTLLSGDVTTALGFTPYNSSNPSGYITASSLAGYAPLTGSGASGTWAINILGNAGNSSQYGGYAHDLQTVVGTGDYLIIRNQAATKLSLASPASVATIVQSGASGTWPITVTGGAAAGSLSGTTLASGVTSSSLTSVGTLSTLNVSGTVTATSFVGNGSGLTGLSSAPVSSVFGRIGAVVMNSADVTSALGFTPYNATNPAGYITGITSGNVTTALGFTPYNATNPLGYITSSSLAGYAPLGGAGASGTWGINVTGSSGSCSGNASTASALAVARTINGVAFDGTANITISAGSAAASSLTGTTLASGVTASSLTSVAAACTVGGTEIGYRRMVPSGITSGSISSADSGKCVYGVGNVTAISNGGMQQGDAITVYNNSASTISILQGVGLTLRKAGSALTGDRALSARGMATILYVSAAEAVVSGVGLS
jgi:hypothetical protein